MDITLHVVENFVGVSICAGPMANPRKRSLSKNLSQMKFMKRQSRGQQEDEETDLGGKLVDKWVVPGIPEPPIWVERFQLVESFVDCEDLNKFGRFSFNNFNKKIERLAECYQTGESPVSDEEEEGEGISAKEVAKRYKELLGKRRRSDQGRGPSSGFLKPSP